MICVNELKDLKIYSRPLYLPINMKDKKRGSAVFLLTPNIKSSLNTMALPYIINNNLFNSYYLERNINYIINNESVATPFITDDYIHEYHEFINEESLNDNWKELVEENVKNYPTVKSVSALIENDEHKYLVIYHNGLDCFSLPGGKVDDSDKNLDDTLIRELMEEFNIRPINYSQFYKTYSLGSYKDSRKNPNMYFDDTTYHITSFSGILKNREPNKCKGYKWMTAKEIINLPNNKKSACLSKFCHLVKSGKIPTNIKASLFNYKDNLINYYGYKSSVNEVKKYIDNKTIKMMCRNVGIAELDAPIDLVIYDSLNELLQNQTDDLSTVCIHSKECYEREFSGKYELYLKTELYAFLLKKYNPNANQLIIYSIAKYKSGECDYDEAEGINITNLRKEYNDLSKICRLIEKDRGFNTLIDIIKKNDMKAFYKLSLQYKLDDSKYTELRSALFEKAEHITNIDQLTRRSKMKARRGSIYKINAIKRFIDKATDPDEKMPDVTDSDGNVLNPTTAPDLQKISTVGDVNKGVEKAPDTIKTEESLLDEYSNLLLKNSLLNEDGLLMINEDSVTSGPDSKLLKQILYKDRLKQMSDVKNIYDDVKSKNRSIKYTYLNLNKYKKLNLFIDLSYYNEVFFTNNSFSTIKSFNLYSSLLKNLLNGKRFTEAGYTKQTVFIPILDWDINKETKMWMYKETINPVSIIYNLMKTDPNRLKEIFKDDDVVFVTDCRYFKINFSHFTSRELESSSPLFVKFIKNMRNDYGKFIQADPEEDPNAESKEAITINIVDKLEKSQGIKIVNLTGKDSPDSIPQKVDDKSDTNDVKVNSNDDEEKKKEDIKNKKEELVDAINKAAENSNNTDDALEELDNDRIKQLIIDLSSEEEDGIKINQARASRMLKLQNDLVDKEVNGIKIKDLLNENREELKETDLKVSGINNDWHSVKSINFDKDYNIDSDIFKMVSNMSHYTRPINIIDYNIEDTSTSEDYVFTYTFKLEDYTGKRFTIKFDIPKLINGTDMKLRGNMKTINIQSFLMPLIKTDNDTCQIISNYNKIFIRRSSSIAGKSLPETDKLIKAISKYDGKVTKVTTGDNSRICNKYELPIDYIDLASLYSKIETTDYIIYFNQDEIRELYDVDESKGLPFAVTGKNKELVYYNPGTILDNDKMVFDTFTKYLSTILTSMDLSFKEVYDTCKPGSRHTYSQASILSTKIPLIVVMAYNEGLTKSLNKAGIEYDFKEKLEKSDRVDDYGFIKFNDGYIVYKINYNSSLLMSGLDICPTEDYSLKEINGKGMYLDFLDNFGGRILADGLDVFYDCMIDPITKELLERYHLPTDYISLLAQANILLSDNKYITHTSYADGNRRFRRAELIGAYLHKALSKSYSDYVQQIKRNRTNYTYSIKQSAVIDLLMLDPTLGDKSFINALSDIEDINSVSTKGLSGMNSERSYSLDKRTYDSSMINIIGMSTGFAGNVGMTRQATIDANIQDARGMLKTTSNLDEMSDTKSLTMTEAVTPFGSTHDDPIRTAMTFIQTAKHNATIYNSDPLLVTNGADEAMPYYTSDMFAFKAKEDGKVIEKSDEYMIVEYKSGKHEYVDLSEDTEKNSNGGYYVVLQKITDLKVGNKFKKDDVLAYEKSSFSNSLGENDNLAYNVGKLVKIAILNSDESFEDSAVVTEKLSNLMATNITIPKSIYLPKETNVYNVVKKGDPIYEGDPLLVMQSPSSEEDVNILLKNLAGDEDEISDLGRIPIKSKITGRVVDIAIYHTCDVSEMSESLQKLVKTYERNINSRKAILKKYGIDPNVLPATNTLPATGKLKNADDGVYIEFFLEYKDVLSVGDKIVYYSANKGVIKYIVPEGQEPYTDFRPNETIDAFVGVRSINARMVCSTLLIAALSKLMVELDRTCKDIAGIKYDDSEI